MASGDTLLAWTPLSNEPPLTNYATLSLLNAHPVLDFDATTQEAAVFTGVLPRNYAGGGITVYVHACMATANSGTLGWLVAFERMSDGTTVIAADSFASDQTITASTVPGTQDIILVLNVAVSNGANIDGVIAGDSFRMRLRRDVANDTATGDAELVAIELKET